MKKIIVKESQLTNVVENVMKEQLSDDPNAFTTDINDVDVYGLEKYFPEYKGRDMDIVNTNCSVNWRYDMDIRSWGIKDISVYTTSVIINVTVEIYDEDYTKVEDEKEIELMVDDMGGFSSDEEGKWHYEDEKEDMRYHTILPTALQIDLNDKHISVMWN